MYVSMPNMRRSRHPLVRALSLLLGLALIGLMLVFGLMVAGVLLLGGGLLLIWRQWTHRHHVKPPPAAQAGHPSEVLEGEFVVIRHDRTVTH